MRADLYDAVDHRPVRSDAEGRRHIQESDAQFIGKRYGAGSRSRCRRGRAGAPLYDQDDAVMVNGMFRQ